MALGGTSKLPLLSPGGQDEGLAGGLRHRELVGWCSGNQAPAEPAGPTSGTFGVIPALPSPRGSRCWLASLTRPRHGRVVGGGGERHRRERERTPKVSGRRGPKAVGGERGGSTPKPKTHHEGMPVDGPNEATVVPGIDSPHQHLVQVHVRAGCAFIFPNPRAAVLGGGGQGPWHRATTHHWVSLPPQTPAPSAPLNLWLFWHCSLRAAPQGFPCLGRGIRK